ncbi:hypothetical protein C7M61_003578 [Candidozyma pseudohaemuli]|uniref:Arf-GAP domain-containing protein n=1 Tax=Candidozyma pseudohaemuli TaxID=418784 RepID=A0A2P7YMF3_9ASCO|nr:hypothetical protein C7M61_003578 [[Candida] pseudohaemulonii]PSK37151.1 hypothetical protein C7M61_003578 [[Candida] pseudohaemulonii]
MSLPSSKKTHSERHKQILKLLLREPANKSCADCKTAQHPRWASWNLGCFVCIRCSGIHRSMGTHISRVKSVDLDAWTDEQVELMLKWGNAKSNGYWEAKLPEGYIPDGLKIENFIRTKYDMKKWAGPGAPNAGNVAPKAAPVVNNNSGSSSSASVLNQPKPANQGAQPRTTRAPPLELLLDDDWGTFSLALPSPAPKPASIATRGSTQLLPAQTKPQPQAPKQLQTQETAPPVPQKNGRTDLKKLILSLYSLPSSSNSNVSLFSSSQTFQAPPAQRAPQQQNTGSLGDLAGLYSQTPVSTPAPREPVNQLSDSLHGLSFSSPGLNQPKPQEPKRSTQAPPKPAQKSPWESNNSINEWASPIPSLNLPQPSNEWAQASVLPKTTIGAATPGQFSSTLDEDLFKNVWS